MFIKICGVRSVPDVEAVVAAGADALGIVFGPSVRQVDIGTARRIVMATPSEVLTVGVFGDVPVVEVAECALESGVGAIQLHGRYPREAFSRLRAVGRPLWRATTLADAPDLRVGAFGEELLLLDAPRAGAGERWDLGALEDARPVGRWMLAGGLNADNVEQAVRVAKPWGVDVSSGVEKVRGVKEHSEIHRFVTNVRRSSSGS